MLIAWGFSSSVQHWSINLQTISGPLSLTNAGRSDQNKWDNRARSMAWLSTIFETLDDACPIPANTIRHENTRVRHCISLAHYRMFVPWGNFACIYIRKQACLQEIFLIAPRSPREKLPLNVSHQQWKTTERHHQWRICWKAVELSIKKLFDKIIRSSKTILALNEEQSQFHSCSATMKNVFLLWILITLTNSIEFSKMVFERISSCLSTGDHLAPIRSADEQEKKNCKRLIWLQESACRST